MAEHFDVAVIGGGPAGYAAALYGAAAGLKIAVVEKDKVGGTCLHRGCIPAKEFLETSAVYRAVGHAKDFGISAQPGAIDFGTSQQRKQKIVDQLWKGLQGLMKRRKITTVHGFGQLAPGKTVRVDDGSELKADHVVLAAGSAPRTIPGFEVSDIVNTSDEVLSWTELPKSAVVVGGGAIGCEFASMLIDLGAEVTLLEVLPKILAGCDKDVADVVVKSFTKRGMKVHTGITDLKHEPTGDGRTKVTWSAGEVTVEKVVVSVGRRPFSDNLLADGTNVQVDERGFVKVDEALRTAEDGVYAVGDLIATPQLAHVGFAEGIQVIKDILGESALPVDYSRVPWCIYTHPEVAFVGYSEEAAKEAGFDVVVKKDPYAGNGRAMIVGDTEGLVKVIAEKTADGKAGQVLGVHMVGPWVTEQLGQAYLTVNWEATVDEVAAFIQPHPTMSEVFGETMLALTGRGLHS